jgi:hypothetical protein
MSAGELTGWLAAALTLLTFTGAPWQRLTQLDAGLALAFLLRSVGVRRHIAGLCPRRGTTKREAQDRICFNAREAHVTDQPSCIALEPLSKLDENGTADHPAQCPLRVSLGSDS